MRGSTRYGLVMGRRGRDGREDGSLGKKDVAKGVMVEPWTCCCGGIEVTISVVSPFHFAGFKEQIYDIYRFLPPTTQVGVVSCGLLLHYYYLITSPLHDLIGLLCN